MVKKRNPIYDIMKGICIFSVILVHIPKEINIIDIPITYHIVGFFFVHGLILNKQNALNDSKRIKVNIKKMIELYFKLSICVLLFNIFIFFATNSSINTLHKIIIDTILLRGTGTLWFFPCYFLGETLLYIEITYYNKSRLNIEFYYYIPVLLLVLVTLIYIKSICIDQQLLLIISLMGESIVSNLFFILGYYFSYIENKYKKKIKSTFVILVIIIVLTILKIFPINIGDLHNFEISYYYVFGSLLGIIFLYSLSVFIHRINIINTFFEWLGKNSLIIMITHFDFKVLSVSVFISNILLKNLFGTNIYLKFSIVLILTTLFEYFIVLAINNTKLKKVFL